MEIFTIADTVAAGLAKVERENRSRKIYGACGARAKEKGRVQNTRPFLHS
jgi:hypothetical protein